MSHVLFALTPGFTLEKWNKIGIMDRELIPYSHHINSGGNVTILECNKRFTNSIRYKNKFKVIRIPHWRIIDVLSYFPMIFDKYDLIKTNQTYKSDVFVKLALKIKKPILLRCGYIGGEFYETVNGLTEEVKTIQKEETWAFQNCTIASVPTSYLKEWVCDRYNVESKKVIVIPNFVDIEKFGPSKNKIKSKNFKICAIGRLVDVKKIDMLINACLGINDLEVEIIGEGPEKENLKSLANKNHIPIRFHGQTNHESLPKILQSCDAYVICSKWEGHPKALIEAMATGLPCIGTDNVGIKNILNNQNGLLVPNSIESLRAALKSLLNDRGLCHQLGVEARKYVVKKYSLNEFLQKDQLAINTAIEYYNEFR